MASQERLPNGRSARGSGDTEAVQAMHLDDARTEGRVSGAILDVRFGPLRGETIRRTRAKVPLAPVDIISRPLKYSFASSARLAPLLLRRLGSRPQMLSPPSATHMHADAASHAEARAFRGSAQLVVGTRREWRLWDCAEAASDARVAAECRTAAPSTPSTPHFDESTGWVTRKLSSVESTPMSSSQPSPLPPRT